nr:MAG TPA: hypothetical protein [Caudoviricetes sp.]
MSNECFCLLDVLTSLRNFAFIYADAKYTIGCAVIVFFWLKRANHSEPPCRL